MDIISTWAFIASDVLLVLIGAIYKLQRYMNDGHKVNPYALWVQNIPK